MVVVLCVLCCYWDVADEGILVLIDILGWVDGIALLVV